MRWYGIISCCAVVLLYFLFRDDLNNSLGKHGLSPSATLTCQVAQVVDGDTIMANCNQRTFRVRFANIDAPELAQSPFGEQAKQALSALIANKTVTLNTHGLDKYQRLLADVYVDDEDISRLLVRGGFAVVYSRYRPPQTLLEAQKSAKKAKIGVWSIKGLQQDPSYFRRIK